MPIVIKSLQNVRTVNNPTPAPSKAPTPAPVQQPVVRPRPSKFVTESYDPDLAPVGKK